MADTKEDQLRAEVFDALGHPTRISILKTLNREPMGFAELKKKVSIESSGHLQHHLNKLNGLIETDENGKYRLSDQGKDALLGVQVVEKAAVPPKNGRSSRILKFLSLALAISLVIVSVVAFFVYVQLQSELESQNNFVWTRDLYARFGSFTVADGKTFTSTYDGDVYCFNQQNGQTLWKQNIGGYVQFNQIFTYNGRVYASSREQRINCLDESSGQILWKFAPNLTSSFTSKTAPLFSIAGGHVFTSGDGFYVLDAATGDYRWGFTPESIPGSIGNWAVDDDYGVFAGGVDANGSQLFHFSITGSILWRYPMKVNSPPVVGDGKVFVWNHDDGKTMTCLDEFTGRLLWQFNAGGTVFQPILNQGLLLFGDSNGNFYALTENGSLKWTFEGRTETYNYPNLVAPRIFGDTVVTSYEADHVTSIGLSTGKLVWRTVILGSALSFTVGSNELFITSGDSGKNLCTLDLSSGQIQNVQIFQYWTLPPVFVDIRLYMAADGKVIAYK